MRGAFSFKDVFKQVRTSSQYLESHERVEYLYDQQPDITAVAFLIETIGDLRWLRDATNEKDVFKVGLAYFYACCDDLKQEEKGYHCGDCVSLACSCERCRYEDMYLKALDMINKYKNMEHIDYSHVLTPQVGKDPLSLLQDFVQHNETIELLGLLFLSEQEITQQHEELLSAIHHNNFSMKFTKPEVFEFEYQYNKWKSMPQEQQQPFLIKAEEYFQMIKTKPKVKDIPWW
jgi:hypothetical protein